MSDPLVSCMMLTYGRVRNNLDGSQLIHEAVESFLRQTYPNKELLIINDAPNQRLIFNHPQVKVVNYSRRFLTLGDKRNAAVAASQGDYLLVWDDDDISLPNRVGATARHFQESGADYASPTKFWFSEHNTNYRLESAGNRGIMCGAGFSRQAVSRVPYRATSVGEDTSLLYDMESAGLKIQGVELPDEETSIIYRWAFLAMHVSGYGNNDGYGIIGNDNLPNLDLYVKPYWQHDYTKVTRDLLKAR